MPIKYVLVGGYPYKAEDSGRAFVEASVTEKKEPVKILLCHFAREEDELEEVFNGTVDFFAAHLEDRELEFKQAEVTRFADQVRWADTVYFGGGDTEKLAKDLSRNTNWVKEMEGKILSGSSAGADVTAKYYFNLDTLKIGEGLGLLPIKVMVHFQSDYNGQNIEWENIHNDLKSYKEDLPVLTLREGEFKVIEQ